MEDEGKIILSAEDEVFAKKVEEGDRFQYGTKEFENQYQSVVEVISRITGIPEVRVTDFFHRGHSLREDYLNIARRITGTGTKTKPTFNIWSKFKTHTL